MEEFVFESIRGKKKNLIKVDQRIHEDERRGLGNYANLHLNKKGGFFIYLLIETLNDTHISKFNNSTPEFRIFTKGDKSYMLVNFSPNLPIFEFLFDISIYKKCINYDEIKKILMNSFQIALVDSNDLIRSVKITQIKEKTYEKFEKALFEAFLNPDFSREYRVFLIPFYEKSTDRWWKIIEEA
jgi:hypothetical protein